MKRILLSLFSITLVVAAAATVTYSEFVDNQTTDGNTFASGTLDLTLDGGDDNVVAFNVGNLKPGSQPKHKYVLENVGTQNGVVDVKNISITNYENGCVEPEVEADDTTCDNPGEGQGELQNVLAMDLYWDNDCSGWYSAGDEYIYDGGYVNGLASSYDTNKPLNAGTTQCVVAIFNWWNTADDNLAQSDSFDLDMTFELSQN